MFRRRVRIACFMNRFLFAVLASLLGIANARAHPVAQGAMELTVQSDKIMLHARVANEQAFVAAVFGTSAPPESEGLPDLWKNHGAYMLEHVHLAADGVPLTGRLVGVTPPVNTTSAARISYDFEYPLDPKKPHPALLKISEDVLNEIEFAPGNRWEASYVVSFTTQNGDGSDGLLLTSQQPLELPLNASPTASPAPRLNPMALAKAYLWHGVMHILTGYDHLLFMAALVLAVVTFGDLIRVVTAFTLAHTLTLTLSVLNLVRLPSQIVEPMIAASIVVVALQNLLWPENSRGTGRLAIAFGFGLFHGLGFAGGLLETMAGLPGVAVATAIIAFSVGVELGHQAVVLPLFAGLKIWRPVTSTAPAETRLFHPALRAGSGVICVAGFVYFVAALR